MMHLLLFLQPLLLLLLLLLMLLLHVNCGRCIAVHNCNQHARKFLLLLLLLPLALSANADNHICPFELNRPVVSVKRRADSSLHERGDADMLNRLADLIELE
jgi:hypothetical protein